LSTLLKCYTLKTLLTTTFTYVQIKLS
jgi:hypothetical protein